ncbi:MAG: hypothetical protein E7453_06680 [Ruminococcaceae bacterium]|nr:hypothetical protein [Oscillospiraceae bacterium]
MDLEKHNDELEQEENLTAEEVTETELVAEEPVEEAVLKEAEEEAKEGSNGAQPEKTEKKAKKVRKPKKKGKPLPVWAAICIAVLAVAVLVLGVIFAKDYFDNKGPFKSYTATEKKLIAAQNKVVATAGEHELTNAELQIYYWVYVYSFLEENSYYLSYLGLDYTQDFATQKCYFDATKSWQEYFLEGALSAWHQYIVLYGAAEASDFVLPESEQEYLDNLKTTMDEQAKKYGYEDGADMVKNEMGAGATWDAYVQYSQETFLGMGYYSQFMEDIKVTEEDIAKHYADNTKKYEENKIAMKDEAYCVSVRHILIKPVTKDADGNAIETEKAWETCRQTAQAILDDYLKAGKIDEDAFAALAKEKTEDTGSKTNGGLYADFTRGEMVEEFETWSFDNARKYGDTGLVKTSYGYHIMFFVDADETYSTSVRHILISPVATKDENGKDVYTDAAWATCKDKAEKLLNEYLKGGKIDEEAFAALAKENTEDTGSKEDGGLYPQVVRGQMVEEFESWCFDTHEYGDTGLVKSTYGYHIMFFVGSDTEWHVFADYDLRMEASKTYLDSLKKSAPIDVAYNKILIGHVELGK